jgi:hypothetical protein
MNRRQTVVGTRRSCSVLLDLENLQEVLPNVLLSEFQFD